MFSWCLLIISRHFALEVTLETGGDVAVVWCPASYFHCETERASGKLGFIFKNKLFRNA